MAAIKSTMENTHLFTMLYHDITLLVHEALPSCLSVSAQDIDHQKNYIPMLGHHFKNDERITIRKETHPRHFSDVAVILADRIVEEAYRIEIGDEELEEMGYAYDLACIQDKGFFMDTAGKITEEYLYHLWTYGEKLENERAEKLLEIIPPAVHFFMDARREAKSWVEDLIASLPPMAKPSPLTDRANTAFGETLKKPLDILRSFLKKPKPDAGGPQPSSE